MKQEIEQRARELGFDACRFTTSASPQTAGAFHRWLASRRQGEMAYLARNTHQRCDPQQVLAGAKSILTLAVSYDSNSKRQGSGSSAPSAPGAGSFPASSPERRISTDVPVAPPASPLTHGLVARYARYADYHQVLGEQLNCLAAFVNQLGGPMTRSLSFVDTGPVLERDLAQRAGLGFIGKHTNLISRQLGNWIFLCEIITTLELEPDAPEPNRCGSCARCITACPTQAITAPFQLDARRCISYLTIELRGSIPPGLRSAIGNRIFGCDDCLAVCPWNRFAQAGKLMQSHARPDLAQPDLLELLALDENAFKRKFAGTPILRARRRGLLRNVCVALGNTGDAAALPALRCAERDREFLIAEPASWAVEQIQARL